MPLFDSFHWYLGGNVQYNIVHYIQPVIYKQTMHQAQYIHMIDLSKQKLFTALIY